MTTLVIEDSIVARRGRAVPVPPQYRARMADAYRALDRAIGESDGAEMFAAAHLAALRGAAAVLTTRARPRRMARGSAWDLLGRVAPEFSDWAVYFAAASPRRQAIVAGVPTTIAAREADDMVRAAGQFLELVDDAVMAPSDR